MSRLRFASRSCIARRERDASTDSEQMTVGLNCGGKIAVISLQRTFGTLVFTGRALRTRSQEHEVSQPVSTKSITWPATRSCIVLIGL